MKQYYHFFATIVACLAIVSPIKAQQVIKMTTVAEVGTATSFGLAAANENTPVRIDWGDGQFVSYTIGKDFSEPKSASKGKNFVIEGDVTRLNVISSKLTTLDVSGCPSLEVLMAAYNYIGEINLTRNTELRNIELFGNSLKSLDVTKCPKLERLVVSGNFLDALNVTECTELTYFDCARMARLNTIDLSQCHKLTNVIINECNIEHFKIATDAPLQEFLADKNNFVVLDLSSFNQLTTVSCSDNKRLTSLKISSPELTSLNAMNGALRGIDLSKCTKLSYLMLGGNASLTALDVTACPQITDLGVSECDLSTIDLSKQSKIINLWINKNKKLTKLDVSACPVIEQLQAKECALKELILPSDPAKLKKMLLPRNQLAEIQLKNLTALKTLDLGTNQFKKVDLSGCPALEVFSIRNCHLSALDLSHNTKLMMVGFHQNGMTSEQLNAVYKTLRTLPKKSGKVNLLNGENDKDKGAKSSDTSIATDKNWTPKVIGDGSGSDLSADELTKATDLTIRTANRTIMVSGTATGRLMIYDLSGRCLFQGEKGEAMLQVTLPAAGSYLASFIDAESGTLLSEKLYLSDK